MAHTFEDIIDGPSLSRMFLPSVHTVNLAGMISLLFWLLSVSLSMRYLQLAYSVTPFFYTNQLFATGSLFILYHRIFCSDRTFVSWIYTIAAIHVCWFIVFFFFTPVSKWRDVVGNQLGYCLDRNAFLISEKTINSSLDFATIIITIAVVRKLQLRQFVKIKLAIIVFLGGLSGVVGFMKIVVVYKAANTNGEENDTNAIWGILQMATSIFCACAPMFKILIPLHDHWTRLKSSVTSLANILQVYKPFSDYVMSSSGYLRNRRRDGRDDINRSLQVVSEWPVIEYFWSSEETGDTEFTIQRPTEGELCKLKGGGHSLRHMRKS